MDNFPRLFQNIHGQNPKNPRFAPIAEKGPRISMKGLKRNLAGIAAALLIVSAGRAGFAFHSGGVGNCEGCHSMHDGQGNSLLTRSDTSSTCLNCHENSLGDSAPYSYHISTRIADLGAGKAPIQRTPGGDFGWLKKTYNFSLPGDTNIVTEDGSTHGHNITAIDNGYVADPVNTTAPGGAFPGAALACTSCHDMHGTYRRLADGTIRTTGLPIAGSGSYHDSPDPVGGSAAVGVFRLLAGKGWTRDGVTFVADPPAAVVNKNYNASEAALQVRDAYGKGMAEWCATCHPDMHTNSGRLIHPVSLDLGATITDNYNRYVKSGDVTGNQLTSFSSLVPYEENTTDYSVLKSTAAATGKLQPGPAKTTVTVMCLSCHRAHASGWPQALRWKYQDEWIIYNGLYPGIDNSSSAYARGRTEAETKAAYYDRPATDFAAFQKMLCNKCHALD